VGEVGVELAGFTVVVALAAAVVAVADKLRWEESLL
jgi:hypothetical protein